MKLQNKSSLFLFVIGIVFLVIISAIYYYLNHNLIIENSQKSSIEIVSEYTSRVRDHLEKDAQIAETLANSPIVTDSLLSSNKKFNRLGEEQRKEEIIRLNNKWLSTKDVDNPFIQSYMKNSTADYLKIHQDLFPEFYGEIFLTNKYGVVVATTEKLTTLAHAHKYWWKDSVNKGKIFFDDRGYDQSVKGYVLGVVVPVKKDGEIIGVLKSNIKILGPYSHIFDTFTENNLGTMSLVRSKGLVIFEKNVEPLSMVSAELLIEKMKDGGSDSYISYRDSSKHIIAYAPVLFSKKGSDFIFGGKHKSEGHVKGNVGEQWFVILSRNVDEVLAASEKLTKKIFIIGFIFTFIIAITALLIGRFVTKPITKLINMTKSIGQGDFKSEVEYSSTDELGTLAKSFNNMVGRLRETTTSRDSLIDEIKHRKVIEEERNKLEQQLHHSQKMEAIGQLTGGIAHDFNNMLASIMGYTELTRDGLAQCDTEKLRGYLDEVYKSSERARDLVAQMLAFSRDSDELHEFLVISPLIRESLKMLGPILPSSTEIDLQLGDESLVVQSNRVQLHQLILNLCINARDAMHGKGHISISLKQVTIADVVCDSCYECVSGEFIQFAVSDTGPGITEEQQEHIFEPFYTTKKMGVIKGTGMGLAMVHGIMHGHGGHIIVESDPGKGTVFKLLFPVLEHYNDVENNPVSNSIKISNQPMEGTVLVVDDEAAVGGFVAELLKTYGCRVVFETDSRSAFNKFKEDPDAYDLLVTDQTMPGTTGVELAQLMMEIRPEFPVILCTGYSDQIDEAGASSLGIRGFMTKPIKSHEFLELVRDLLPRVKKL